MEEQQQKRHLKQKLGRFNKIIVRNDDLFNRFRNKVYMGKPKVKPKKNILDQMFEQVMHSTGHEQMRRKK